MFIAKMRVEYIHLAPELVFETDNVYGAPRLVLACRNGAKWKRWLNGAKKVWRSWLGTMASFFFFLAFVLRLLRIRDQQTGKTCMKNEWANSGWCHTSLWVCQMLHKMTEQRKMVGHQTKSLLPAVAVKSSNRFSSRHRPKKWRKIHRQYTLLYLWFVHAKSRIAFAIERYVYAMCEWLSK